MLGLDPSIQASLATGLDPRVKPERNNYGDTILNSADRAPNPVIKYCVPIINASANQTALQGIMTDGATRIGISATHKIDFTPLEVSAPTGYIFRIKGRPVGAVEVINKGTVWLHNSVTPETRSALAATSAVLLLYQDIKKSSQ